MTTPFAQIAFRSIGDVAPESHRESPRGTGPRPSRGARGLALALLAIGLIAPAASAEEEARRQIDAFPGAEGAGRHSSGGRGGLVLYVTTLADSGPGSLRAAIDRRGPRVITFEVAGTIALESALVVRHGQLTIAGQSAPGDGVALSKYPLVIAADDVVVRYLRSRLGDRDGVAEDAISITRGRRIILDHISASWSLDETLSVASRYNPPEAGPYDVTVQWSIISESLNRSRHAKGDHGYGTLVRGAHGARITFHHNLWAHHRARSPRPGNYLSPAEDPVGPLIEFRSNVFYNWGGRFAGYDADKAQRVTYNFIDNAYVAGPDSIGALAFQEKNTQANAYFSGNSMNGAVPADPWSLVEGSDRPGYRLERAALVGAVAPDSAESALSAVLARAGAAHARDAVDARIVASVRERSGRIIDSQQDVGGWPELRGGPAPIDTDRDGMPDVWELANGLNPDDPADGRADRNNDGYTELEDYLNGLID